MPGGAARPAIEVQLNIHLSPFSHLQMCAPASPPARSLAAAHRAEHTAADAAVVAAREERERLARLHVFLRADVFIGHLWTASGSDRGRTRGHEVTRSRGRSRGREGGHEGGHEVTRSRKGGHKFTREGGRSLHEVTRSRGRKGTTAGAGAGAPTAALPPFEANPPRHPCTRQALCFLRGSRAHAQGVRERGAWRGSPWGSKCDFELKNARNVHGIGLSLGQRVTFRSCQRVMVLIPT